MLTALAFAESSCNPRAMNRRSHSVGLLQIKIDGSANPWHFTRAELKNPWLNADLGARHLRLCIDKCGTLGRALGIYHGNKRGCVEDGFARRVLQLASELEAKT